MATKLKRYSSWLKACAFITAVALSTVMVIKVVDAPDAARLFFEEPRNLNVSHYTESSEFEDDINELRFQMGIIAHLKSEENILKTERNNGIDSDRILEKVEEEKASIKESLLATGVLEKDITDEMLQAYLVSQEHERNANSTTQFDLQNFKNAERAFQNRPELTYYIKSGETVFTNSSSDYETLVNEKYSHHPNFSSNDALAVVVFKESYIDEKNKQFLIEVKTAKKLIEWVVFCGLIILICFAYLVYATGRKSSDPMRIHHPFLDRMYNEITAALLFGSFWAVVGCALILYTKVFNRDITIGLLAASIVVFFSLTLVLVRHLKSKTLFTHSIIGKIIRKIIQAFKNIYSLGSPSTKIISAIVVLGLLTMIPIVGVVTVPLAVFLAYRQLSNYIKIKNGIEVVRNGVYTEHIDVTGSGELAAIATNVNQITAGLSSEVDRRLKSERLKTELIVNVSHDIRTPLTSLITYADLLQKESIDNENAQKYIGIISQKADRLKVLIDDLFDAAKAASGNIAVNFEKVELVSLVTQGLGELDDKITESALDFKVTLPEDKVFAKADGRLLWRVVENLLSNVFKYSLAHSRVYLSVFEDENRAYVEIKNISATELNIPSDELTERFKRGDQSRSSEGSGLGLDIAKSLMTCQNGTLNIKIDGDLFKATISVEKYNSAL